MKSLHENVSKMLEKIDLVERTFDGGEEKNIVEEKIESFMQNA